MGKIIQKQQIAYALIILFIVVCLMSCTNTDMTVVIEGQTELLYQPDFKDTPGNKVIAVLNGTEKGKVIHTRHSKDTMFYKIKLDDGRTGYIMYGGKFRVSENKN